MRNRIKNTMKALVSLLLIGTFSMTNQLQAQTLGTFFDDIESQRDFAITDLVGWTTIDYDKNLTSGPFFEFTGKGQPAAWVVYNPSKTVEPNTMEDWIPYSGNKMLVSMSSGKSNDWLITKELRANNGGTFSFWAKTIAIYFGNEEFKVGYSLTNTDSSSFVFFNQGNPTLSGEKWKQYSYDIPANAKYITIVCVSDNKWAFAIDDIHLKLNSPASAPKGVSNAVVLADQTGALKANLSWKNPSLQEDGSVLNSLTSVKIFRGTTLRTMTMVKEFTNPTIGADLNYEDVVSSKNSYFYMIAAYNANGESQHFTSVSTYLGLEKVAGATKEIKVTYNSEQKSVISWKPVNYGQYGGVLEAPVLAYSLIRKTFEKNDANKPRRCDTIMKYRLDTIFVETEVPPLYLYTYEVIAYCGPSLVGIPARTVAYSGKNANQYEVGHGNLRREEPFLAMRKSSISQSIYTPKQVKTNGVITKLTYFTDYFYDEGDKADKSKLKIYMSTTPTRTFGLSVYSFKWIYFGTQTLVANQEITFKGGANAVDITLDQPFYYDPSQGENLVITVVKPLKANNEMPLQQMYYLLASEVDTMGVTLSCNASVTDLSEATNQPAYWQSELFNYVPNIVLNTVDNFAKFKGKLIINGTETTIDSALVEITATKNQAMNWNGYTNALGMFEVKGLLPNTYQVSISKKGFGKRNIILNLLPGTDTTYIFDLYNATPMVIHGVVKNKAGEVLQGTDIDLSGYSSEKAISDANGEFTINAYQNQDFQLKFNHPLYKISNFQFNKSVSTFDTIFVLNLKYLPPSNLMAKDSSKIGVVTWEKPVGTKNTIELAWGPKNNLGNAWGAGGPEFISAVRFTPSDLGSMLVQNSKLTQVRAKINAKAKIVIEIYEDINAATLLYKQEQEVITPGWYVWDLNTHVKIDQSKDLYIAIRFPMGYGAYPIGIDDGPQVAGKGNCINEGKGWTTMSMNGKNWNIYGITSQTMDAAPLAYNVKRGLKGDEDNVKNWTNMGSVTSTDFIYKDLSLAVVEPGVYIYAVQAKYEQDSLSLFSFSNDLRFNMEFDIALEISSNVKVPYGAFASLQMADYSYQYEGKVDANGKLKFPAVWRGNYELRVQFANHENISYNITVNKDTTYKLSLKEIIAQVENIGVERTETTATIKWGTYDRFVDNMETYTNFSMSSIGDYILNDVDKLVTFTYDNFNFPNEGSAMSYMVFNPFATVPPIKGANPHSGQRYLGSFGEEGVGNDWLIIPAGSGEFSFWARSLTNEQLESMIVYYSTSNTAISSFVRMSETGAISVPTTWKKYVYTAPLGTKFLAIRKTTDEGFLFFVDDINYNKLYTHAVSYTVYLDGNQVAEGLSFPSYTFEGISKGKHTAGIKAVYISGESEIANVDIYAVSNEELSNKSSVNIYPNPSTSGKFTLNLDDSYTLTLYDFTGRIINTFVMQKGLQSLDLSTQSKGLYILQIENSLKKMQYKLVY